MSYLKEGAPLYIPTLLAILTAGLSPHLSANAQGSTLDSHPSDNSSITNYQFPPTRSIDNQSGQLFASSITVRESNHQTGAEIRLPTTAPLHAFTTAIHLGDLESQTSDEQIIDLSNLSTPITAEHTITESSYNLPRITLHSSLSLEESDRSDSPLYLSIVEDVNSSEIHQSESYTTSTDLQHTFDDGDLDWLDANFNIDYGLNQSDSPDPDISSVDLELSTSLIFDWASATAELSNTLESGIHQDSPTLEVSFAPTTISLHGITLSGELELHKILLPEASDCDPLTNCRWSSVSSSLDLSEVEFPAWIGLESSAIHFNKVFDANLESIVSIDLEPNIVLSPSRWSQLDLSYINTHIAGDPELLDLKDDFSTRHRLETGLSLSIPGSIESEQQDITTNDYEYDSTHSQPSFSLGLEADTAFDFLEDRWETVSTELSLSTPTIPINITLSTDYNPNDNTLLPIQLQYDQIMSISFGHNSAQNSSVYAANFALGFDATYDHFLNDLHYGLTASASLERGTNNWQIQVAANHLGLETIKLTHTAGDINVSIAADRPNESFRIEAEILPLF